MAEFSACVLHMYPNLMSTFSKQASKHMANSLDQAHIAMQAPAHCTISSPRQQALIVNELKGLWPIT